MTCIVGLVEGGVTYLGGDSAGVSGLDVTVRKDKKVFRKGEMLFGFTTSFRMGQLIQFSFTPPPQKSRQTDFSYLCTDFVKELRECLEINKWAKVTANVTYGGTFILGYKGNLYTVYSDFQISQAERNYAACGCGERYALGALYVMNKYQIDPRTKVELALGAAAENSAGVCKPFHVFTMK